MLLLSANKGNPLSVACAHREPGPPQASAAGWELHLGVVMTLQRERRRFLEQLASV